MRCPTCGGLIGGDGGAVLHSPFCSERCSRVDLGRWFSGHYSVAGAMGEVPEETQEEVPEDAREEGQEDAREDGVIIRGHFGSDGGR